MPEKVSFTIKLPCKKARDPKDRKSRIRLSDDVLSDLHMVSDAAASQILQTMCATWEAERSTSFLGSVKVEHSWN